MTLPKRDGIWNKILVGVSIALITSFLGWGTWVTVVAFDVEAVVACAQENKVKIDKKSDELHKQIRIGMDKTQNQLNRQDDKLNDIMKILINMNNKEK